MNVYNFASRETNQVALTFDDGPNPCWTEKILDILNDYSVKANFFVLGKWAPQHPDIVARIIKEGHLIGNHTYSHSRLGSDFTKAEKIIFDIIKEPTKFIRPPYLYTINCCGYRPARQGLAKIINGDVVPNDWKNKAADIQKTIEQKTKNGSIIILHDGSQKETELAARPAEMVKALPLILEKLTPKFNLARLDELTF